MPAQAPAAALAVGPADRPAAGPAARAVAPAAAPFTQATFAPIAPNNNDEARDTIVVPHPPQIHANIMPFVPAQAQAEKHEAIRATINSIPVDVLANIPNAFWSTVPLDNWGSLPEKARPHVLRVKYILAWRKPSGRDEVVADATAFLAAFTDHVPSPLHANVAAGLADVPDTVCLASMLFGQGQLN